MKGIMCTISIKGRDRGKGTLHSNEENGNDRNAPGETWDADALRDKAVVFLMSIIPLPATLVQPLVGQSKKTES